MAELAGMSNPRSASNAMATIRKKLSANMPATSEPKTPGGRSKKRNADDDDEEDPLKGQESPTKKNKANGKAKATGKGAAKGKKGAVKKEDTPTEDDESDGLADGEHFHPTPSSSKVHN